MIQFDSRITELAEKAEHAALSQFNQINRIAELNTMKVLSAFCNNNVSDAHFHPTSGYGYDDLGRDTLDKIYAEVFGAEAALVRHNFVSGTHALSVMLFSVLRPGDTLLCATGSPYDTLFETISGNSGSLKDFGIAFKKVALKDGKPDKDAIKEALTDSSVKAVLLQRSKGYDWRPSLTIKDMKELIDFIKAQKPDACVLVDNCYGEFVEESEPTEIGADLMAGSLIKNPGGGIAPTGGYVAGKKELVNLAANRLSAPGIGLECGATLGITKSFYQGFFMAPHSVANALKTAVFCGNLMKELGFPVCPDTGDRRTDIIQAIKFGDAEKIVAFCKGLQKASPIDSHVSPEPWDMPGYSDKVIMAAGAFNQGSSIEISADGPIREPFVCYMQGGLTYESGKIAVMSAAQQIIKL